MPAPLIKTGYDFLMQFAVELDGGPDDLTGATFTACVKDNVKRLELIPDQVASIVGDPLNGIVQISFPASMTTNLITWLALPQSTLFQSTVVAAGPVFIELAKVVNGIRYPIADCEARVEYGFALG